MNEKSLYERLGGYDSISAFANDLLPRLQADNQLGRFWAQRGDACIAREKHLLSNFLISKSDWGVFLSHAGETINTLQIPQQETKDMLSFVLRLKDDIFEA